MSVITVGAAQLGPIGRAESRGAVVKRLIAHLQEARGGAATWSRSPSWR